MTRGQSVTGSRHWGEEATATGGDWFPNQFLVIFIPGLESVSLSSSVNGRLVYRPHHHDINCGFY